MRLTHCNSEFAEEEVRLSIDVWTSLLADFIRDVIGQPVYIAGNSLGGYLTANLAAQQPSLCRRGHLLLCMQELTVHAPACVLGMLLWWPADALCHAGGRSI
jgi:pimeloyl-ACP methyl ester carboxylesterase